MIQSRATDRKNNHTQQDEQQANRTVTQQTRKWRFGSCWGRTGDCRRVRNQETRSRWRNTGVSWVEKFNSTLRPRKPKTTHILLYANRKCKCCWKTCVGSPETLYELIVYFLWLCIHPENIKTFHTHRNKPQMVKYRQVVRITGQDSGARKYFSVQQTGTHENSGAHSTDKPQRPLGLEPVSSVRMHLDISKLQHTWK